MGQLSTIAGTPITIEFLPVPNFGKVFMVNLVNHPMFFYNGRRELVQVVMTEDGVTQLKDLLNANNIPFRIHRPVRQKTMRTPDCPTCPFYQGAFRETCSLHWGGPVDKDLRMVYLRCEDPQKPADNVINFVDMES
jgi:hypothetical protein